MKRLRLLIVEDHPFQRALLEQSLRQMGYECIVVAENGAHAVGILDNSPVDVVITDLMMPTMDGIELIPRIRATRPEVGVILTSASKACLDAASAIAAGHGVRLLGAITKPVVATHLSTLLDDFARIATPETASPSTTQTHVASP